MIAIVTTVFLGVLLALAASFALFLGWWTLLPWGIGGLALGYVFPGRATVLGALYGFVLCFTFMLAGYSGTASLVGRVPFFALIGLVGAVCGFVLGFAGSRLKRFRSRSVPPNAA